MGIGWRKSARSRWQVGLDVGLDVVKGVCLFQEHGSYTLTAYGKVPLSHVSEFFQSREARNGSIRVNIEDSSLRIRRMLIPQVPDKERPEIIKWSLEGVVEGSVEDYVVRYQKLPVPSGEEGKEVYIVFAIAKEAVQKRLANLTTWGVRHPDLLEPSPVSLALSYIHQAQLGEGEQHILIDLGANHALFLVVDKDTLFYCRPLIGFSAQALTKTISRNMGQTLEQAEALKLSYVHGDADVPDRSGQDIRLDNTISHFVSKLVHEVQRSIDVYQTEFPAAGQIQGMAFAGGGAQLSGLAPCVAQGLNLPLKLFHPFVSMHAATFSTENLNQEASAYSTACGLAL